MLISLETEVFAQLLLLICQAVLHFFDVGLFLLYLLVQFLDQLLFVSEELPIVV